MDYATHPLLDSSNGFRRVHKLKTQENYISVCIMTYVIFETPNQKVTCLAKTWSDVSVVVVRDGCGLHHGGLGSLLSGEEWLSLCLQVPQVLSKQPQNIEGRIRFICSVAFNRFASVCINSLSLLATRSWPISEEKSIQHVSPTGQCCKGRHSRE